jgi:hypothetical protein
LYADVIIIIINITACPPMVSIPHQWLCLLWSKPRKNYEL